MSLGVRNARIGGALTLVTSTVPTCPARTWARRSRPASTRTPNGTMVSDMTW
jgi:hypothetical protein